MKVTINLKPKTIRAIINYSNENNKNFDHSIEEAVINFLDPGYEQDYDELLQEAIKLSKIYKNINSSLLQRKLGIGYARAIRLLNKLQN